MLETLFKVLDKQPLYSGFNNNPLYFNCPLEQLYYEYKSAKFWGNEGKTIFEKTVNYPMLEIIQDYKMLLSTLM